MENTGTLKLTTPREREIVLTRVFDAPRALVWDALTRPELVKRWLLGTPGWSMVVCEIDLKVGGAYRDVWRRRDGTEMGMGGLYREILPPERSVHTESFDSPLVPRRGAGDDDPGRARRQNHVHGHDSLRVPRGPRRRAQDPMEQGVAASYDRLAELLASTPARGASQAGRR